ncbi:MAG TPA: hypothetical protein VG603_16655 [Chitinophagales bacterium]|nr:hypothetical protein [Chitinophagales bacterium]
MNLPAKITFCLAAGALCTIAACSKVPVACYTADADLTNLHKLQTVSFVATCSENAKAYDWRFYNTRTDSIFYGEMVSKVFSDTGNYTIFLSVSNKKYTDVISQDVFVNP